MKLSAKVLWYITTTASSLAGLVLLVFGLSPFVQLKPFFDHLSKDGSMASFTQAGFSRMAPFATGTGLCLLLLGVVFIVLHRRSLSWVGRFIGFVGREWAAIRRDGSRVVAAVREQAPARSTVLAAGFLTLAAGASRLVFINRAFSHDEAYTYEAFAARPLIELIGDYHLPNNHVLHTIFVHISTQIFGNAPWAVRLPAFLAGVLLVPAAFLLAKRLYNWNTALLSAALVAAAPDLISYSTNARGYTLLALISLLIWSLGLYLKDHKNRVGWLGLGVLASLGFYTLPVMLYPYGILLTWLFISNLMDDRGAEYKNRWSMVRYMFISGLVTVGLTLLFYTPIFINSGTASFFNNTFVESLSWSDFVQTLPHRLSETWQEWQVNIPGLVWALLMAGVFLSLGLHHWIAKNHRFPFQFAAILWLTGIMILQRPNPWAKVWLYLYPLMLIWASAGLLGLVQDFYLRSRQRLGLQSALATFLVAVIVVWNGIYSISNYTENNTPKEIEKTAAFLKAQLQDGMILVVDPPNDAPLWYYARLQQLPHSFIFPDHSRSYTTAVVIVNPNFQQTVESVLKDRGPTNPVCDPSRATLWQKIDNTDIYQCTP